MSHDDQADDDQADDGHSEGGAMMGGERSEWLNATMERIADALERIADRLDAYRADKDKREEDEAVLQERIEEAEARRKHQQRYAP